ncbi:dolichol-phosphate mannosyltransferase subunit 3 [Polychytrium aggregatum]|uniref:dolichol-phosphate mannosyltransferase subunit 3 n=1 Tax=Polychytrium aggregatum TaxID=110093 RepID=UPI0022FEDC18|nr:dolichol-phosphate mannosyltransferase subunit 3 [Polychytrium aggregatum]KAI9206997.1 dolichol-phosphate mannosyltransferase subunit 3 [Polychytrium aggregatum]
MSRATTALVNFLIFSLIWSAALFHDRLSPGLAVPYWFDQVVAAFPLWLLVTFGSYSLANIGWALVTFGDCPDAHKSLLQEIQAAKSDLRGRGVSVGN